MLRKFLERLTGRRLPRNRSRRRSAWDKRWVPTFEPLCDRVMPAVTATFLPSTGVLSVFGDVQNNTITISRDAAGKILVNNGAVAVKGGTPTVANTALISAFGLGGNDTITLNESNGALPKAQLFGGDGNDVLTGGSGADLIFGQAGNDTLLGKGGNDFLFGGAGNDVLTGGDGDDQVFGESGNDRMVWNPGDDTDLNEGGAGLDTVEVNGGNGAETFTVTPNGSRVRFDRITPAPFTIDIGTSESLVVNMNGGDDTFTASNGLATLISLTVDGGTGNDVITGGDGNDQLLGGDGNDLVIGGRGNDTAQLGAGDDTFVWNPGDGSDVVEGQDGTDTLQFNGANIAEKIDLSANGGRLRFTRDVASITMDVNGTERVNFVALGGADQITVGDLTGTAVTEVNLDLSAPAGSGTGDGAVDVVTVKGSAASDNVSVVGAGSSVAVTGLAATVQITGAEGTNDQLLVNAQGGDDVVNASGLPATVIGLTIDGGTGNDVIVGSQGADKLFGGDGNDAVIGGRGDDAAFLGAGDDVFTWNPGDGSDVVEGQDGVDTLQFNGANIAEKIDLSANGGRLRFTRDVASITMDTDDVERVNFVALGGADQITVNDLSGTDVTEVNLNLQAMGGGGDGAADSVIVNGTAGADQITVGVGGGTVTVAGLPAKVNIAGSEMDRDQLTINALGGADTVNASGLMMGAIGLVLNGGAGDDVLVGSQGDDLVVGGTGNDTALLGAGDDTFVWNPGDGSDVVEGQDGFDTLQFNGANIAEKIDLSANGSRLRFTRDVASITMDVDGTERVNFKALGGADQITVNDLSGTAVQEVNLDLQAGVGGGDGAVDTVIINGTTGDDVVTVAGDASGVSAFGLAAQVNIIGAEATDRLTVQGQAGDDVVEATGLAPGVIQFTADGGDGDDVLIGSAGNESLLGGAGDDVLIGNGGVDVLNGGPGDNVILP